MLGSALFRFVLRSLSVFALVSGFASVTQGQTPASCKFTVFPAILSTSDGETFNVAPKGINDWGTVVGEADFQRGEEAGFIRWANSGITFPMGKNSDSSLSDRNDMGISVGSKFPDEVLLKGTTVTHITLNIGNVGFFLSGINKWGSIVGTYLDANSNIHGFKRWKNGGALTLDFPGASQTFPIKINDAGVVVGGYADTTGSHGFIYHNNQWATLDFPNSKDTVLTGINDAGVIIGNIVKGPRSFLYENGTFKVIPVPNPAANWTIVTGMSSKRGLITGISGTEGFTATCR